MSQNVIRVRETIIREFGSWSEFRRMYGHGWIVQLAWLLSSKQL